MKKLFLATSLVAIIASSSAFAKTEGSYFGIDALHSTIKFNERYSQAGQPNRTNLQPSYSSSALGVGATYKYAFNFNDFFLAPGIFFERNNVRAYDAHGGHAGDSRRLDIKHRSGIKLDAGYDITNSFSTYLTGGYSRSYYQSRNYHSLYPGNLKTLSGYVGDWFYGAGLKFDCTKNVSLNLEYNYQATAIKTSIPFDNDYSGIYKTKLGVAKLGLYYKF